MKIAALMSGLFLASLSSVATANGLPTVICGSNYIHSNPDNNLSTRIDEFLGKIGKDRKEISISNPVLRESQSKIIICVKLEEK